MQWRDAATWEYMATHISAQQTADCRNGDVCFNVSSVLHRLVSHMFHTMIRGELTAHQQNLTKIFKCGPSRSIVFLFYYISLCFPVAHSGTWTQHQLKAYSPSVKVYFTHPNIPVVLSLRTIEALLCLPLSALQLWWLTYITAMLLKELQKDHACSFPLRCGFTCTLTTAQASGDSMHRAGCSWTK